MTLRPHRRFAIASLLAITLCAAPFTAPAGGQADEESATPPERTPSTQLRPDGAYRIGAGDVLELNVFEVPEMARSLAVRDDGTFPVPLVGDVPVAGRTLREAELEIERRLKDLELVVEPDVTLAVDRYASLAVAVLGAVGSPGIHQLTGGTTLLELLAQAGGIGPNAGDRILILRSGDDGRPRAFLIDAPRLFVDGSPSLNVRLRPDDVVMIPPAEDVRVFVAGGVGQPGAVTFDRDRGMTLLQAIIAAGGSPNRKDGRSATIIRAAATEGREVMTRQLSSLWTGQGDDLALEPGDIIVVGAE